MTYPLPQPWLDAMLEAVCLVDEKSLAVLAANGAAAKLLGRTVQELVGQSVLGFVATPQDHVFWAEPVDAIADGIHSETSVLHANGALIAVERQLRRVPLPGGGTAFIVYCHVQPPATLLAGNKRRHALVRVGFCMADNPSLEARSNG